MYIIKCPTQSKYFVFNVYCIKCWLIDMFLKPPKKKLRIWQTFHLSWILNYCFHVWCLIVNLLQREILFNFLAKCHIILLPFTLFLLLIYFLIDIFEISILGRLHSMWKIMPRWCIFCMTYACLHPKIITIYMFVLISYRKVKFGTITH